MSVIVAERRPQSHLASVVWGAWSRFWFTPIPAARVGLLRIWLFGFVVLDVLLRKETTVAMGGTSRLFWQPVGATWVLDQLGVGPPNGWQIRAVQVLAIAAAFAAMIGYRYRLVAPLAALLYLYWQCLGQSWGEMKHARVTLVLALLFIGVVAASQRRSVDAIRERARRSRDAVTTLPRPELAEPSRDGAWAVRAIQVGLAVLYFLSGYSKLRSIGIDWMWGDTLRQAIQDKASSGETTALGFWVLRQRGILVLFQVVALLWEVCFPLIFLRRLRYPVIVVGLLFNIGLWTTVKIEFFGVVACFAAFLPLEQWAEALRSWWTRRSPRRSVEVLHDPVCPRCAQDVSVGVLADWGHRLTPVPTTRGGSAAANAIDLVAGTGATAAPLLVRWTWSALDRAPGGADHIHAGAAADVPVGAPAP